MEGRRSFQRHLLPDHIGRTGRKQALHLLFGKIAAMPVVAAELIPLLVQGVEPLLGAEAVVGVTGLDQLLRVGQVNIAAFALDIWAAAAADVGALVVLEAHLLQRAVNDIHSALYQTLLIGILDAQDKIPAHRFGNQVFIQRRTQVPDVHEAGRAGRKSCSDSFGLHQIRSFLSLNTAY